MALIHSLHITLFFIDVRICRTHRSPFQHSNMHSIQYSAYLCSWEQQVRVLPLFYMKMWHAQVKRKWSSYIWSVVSSSLCAGLPTCLRGLWPDVVLLRWVEMESSLLTCQGQVDSVYGQMKLSESDFNKIPYWLCSQGDKLLYSLCSQGINKKYYADFDHVLAFNVG